MACPIDYSLCRQTVTVYRKSKDTIQRLVVEGCYYVWEDVTLTDVLGTRVERRFLLIMPGCCQRVFPGDRIYNGVGPEEVTWQEFIPVKVDGLSEAAYVRPSWWGGNVCHFEAGRK